MASRKAGGDLGVRVADKSKEILHRLMHAFKADALLEKSTESEMTSRMLIIRCGYLRT